MLDGLVFVGVAVGDTDTTGEEPGVAVPVAVAVAFGVVVAVGVAVLLAAVVAVELAVGVVAGVLVAAGVGVEVGPPLLGSEVSGKFASRLSISLILGVTPVANLVTVTTVTVVALPVPERGLSTRSSNVTERVELFVLYFPCNAFVIASCTFVSMRVLRRIQTF